MRPANPYPAYSRSLPLKARLALLAATLAALALGALLPWGQQAYGAGSNTLEDIYGVSRMELVNWLTSHENDSYYLGTPYKPYDWRSPRGDINGYGIHSDGKSAGMNCTGFVWHALCAAHGWRDDIAQRLPALQGWANAITAHGLETYRFSSKQAMLDSGILEKGDVIWMWDGSSSTISDFHHVGFFWGDDSHDDRLWHSSGDQNNGWSGMNAKTDIHGKASKVSFEVLKLGGSLPGAIALHKTSRLPQVSAHNPNYSLGNAVYGLFDSEQSAALHRASQALRTFETDAQGHFTSAMDIPCGTYYVSECASPAGYALDEQVYPVTISAQTTVSVGPGGTVSDTPITNPVSFWAAKRDGETASGEAQGSAALEGAWFRICYYPGFYTTEEELPEPERSWVVATDHDGIAYGREDLKVSGDEFYRTADGRITLPLGTVSAQEIKPPEGYLLGDGTETTVPLAIQQITGLTSQAEIALYTAPTCKDMVMRGGVALGKTDRQNGGYKPQGAAALEGAVFSVINENPQPVVVEGTAYRMGEVVKTIETEATEDGRFIATTGERCLPVGSYGLKESSSSEGYLLDAASQAWRAHFQITEDGQMVDLTDEPQAAANQVLRGDFSFTKADGITGKRLGSVPFAITSQTTKESHVLVTDANGMASTSSSWNPHARRTNGNDWLLEGETASDEQPEDPESTPDEPKEGPEGSSEAAEEEPKDNEAPSLDTEAGIWFSGRSDCPVAPDDALGALPFDTYRVKELRCAANEGYTLAEFTVRISRDKLDLDLGTVDDNPGPLVGTSLGDSRGVKLAPAGAMVTITDEVHYANLDPQESYRLEGELHLVTAEGADGGMVAQSQTAFQPPLPDGSAGVDFSLDTSDLAGQRLVAFETLKDNSGTVLAVHKDITYEGQTVRVPELATSLTVAGSDEKNLSANEVVSLTDTVSYRGLTPGETYELLGTLHRRNADGSDGGVIQDANGREVIARQSFTADASEGTVEVSFEFKAPKLGGTTIVAFEQLLKKEAVYAAHADIADEGQSVFLKGANPPETPAPGKLAQTGDPLGPVDQGLLLTTLGAAMLMAICERRRFKPQALLARRGLKPPKPHFGLERH